MWAEEGLRLSVKQGGGVATGEEDGLAKCVAVTAGSARRPGDIGDVHGVRELQGLVQVAPTQPAATFRNLLGHNVDHPAPYHDHLANRQRPEDRLDVRFGDRGGLDGRVVRVCRHLDSAA